MPESVRPTPNRSPSSWSRHLREAFRDPAELCRHLDVDPGAFGDIDPAFPLLVPRPYVGRMRRGDSRDPLLRQVLPPVSESRPAIGYTTDPVQDRAAITAPGLLQKYRGRALLISSGACAVHCRYCFRRHFPYDESPSGANEWDATVRAIAADTSITEVILSGGDPLSLVDESLISLARRIERVDHVERLRLHSRLPIVIPDRITEQLVEFFTDYRLPIAFVTHVNHPNEIDSAVTAALGRISKAGVRLLNQAVLLRGVNDEISTLERLSVRLFDAGVLPYYLHQLDRVAGAEDYDVDSRRGRWLIETLRARMPGYLVPRYVADKLDKSSKTPLA